MHQLEIAYLIIYQISSGSTQRQYAWNSVFGYLLERHRQDNHRYLIYYDNLPGFVCFIASH